MFKRNLLAVLLWTIALPTSAMANAAPSDVVDDLNQVSSFQMLGRMDSWNDLGRGSLIIWLSPARPYLLTLQGKAHDLRYVNHIGITTTAGRVSAGFDEVIVNGWRYPIASIYELDRPTAKALLSSAHRS